MFNKNNEAVFTDMSYLKIQKGIWKLILKQLSSNILHENLL